MSNLERHSEPSLSSDYPPAAQAPLTQRIVASTANLGDGFQIRRALPTRQRRLIGPWCFLDHIGPANVANNRGLRVGPHPHTGLQTVTWLMSGEFLHRDSLGSLQTIVPGQLNLMTSGRGICHSEESPTPRSPEVHGVQLWIALPESARHGPPAFDHYAALPILKRDGILITVLAGEMSGERSPARSYSPLAGLDLSMPANSSIRLPLRPDFEYGVLVTQGEVKLGVEQIAPGTLLYLGQGRSETEIAAPREARVIIVGGEPFPETVLMWWNFVARTKNEITQACQDWNSEAPYFGAVAGYDGARLIAPYPPWGLHP